MKTKITFIAVTFLFAAYFLFPTTSSAQSGSLDLTFGTGGKVTTAIGSDDDMGSSIAIQSDGKIVVAGYSFNGSNTDFALVRYTTTGALDATFGIGGKVTTDITGNTDNEGNSVVIQSDGKIVVAGYRYNGSNLDYALVRYTTTGTLDATFGTGGKVTTDFSSYDKGMSIAIQSDGKIVVAGYFFDLVRYTTIGTLDTTFGVAGRAITAIGSNNDYRSSSVDIQSDGKIVVAGYSDNNFDKDFALIRYTANGILDTTFGTGGKVTTDFGGSNNVCESVAIQSDGKIVMAGYSNSTSSQELTLARYTITGALDTTFGNNGYVFTYFGDFGDFVVSMGSSVTIQTDGKIVVLGSIGVNNIGSTNWDNDFALVRYTTTGDLDAAFGTGGRIRTDVGSYEDVGTSVAIQSDGKIVAVGANKNNSQYDIVVVRYNNTIAGIANAVEQKMGIKIYPSPSSGIFNIEWNGKKNAYLHVSNLLGEDVLQQQISKNIVFTLSQNGIYFVKIYDGEKIYLNKIVVE